MTVILLSKVFFGSMGIAVAIKWLGPQLPIAPSVASPNVTLVIGMILAPSIVMAIELTRRSMRAKAVKLSLDS